MSVRKTIAERSEEIIEAAEKLSEKINELEQFAREHNQAFRHYFIFRKDLEHFISLFKRMS